MQSKALSEVLRYGQSKALSEAFGCSLRHLSKALDQNLEEFDLDQNLEKIYLNLNPEKLDLDLNSAFAPFAPLVPCFCAPLHPAFTPFVPSLSALCAHEPPG